jgi:hypothetical protein
MEPFWPLLTSLVLLATAAGQAADDPSGWQAVLDEYAGSGPAEQQQRIRVWVGRLDRANRVVLAPGEAAAQQARHAAMLRESAQGRPIPQAGLLELLRETDRQEKGAIERLARQFRMVVYDTFRLQRDEYTRRRAAWDRIRATWEAAGGPFDQQARLIDWLEAALRSSTPGSIAPLPDGPATRTGVPPVSGAQGWGRGARGWGLEDGRSRDRSPPRLAPDLRAPNPEPLAPNPEPRIPSPEPPQMQPAGPPQALPPAIPPQVAAGQPAPGRTATDRPAVTPRRQPAELPVILGEFAPVSVPPMPLSSRDVAALVVGSAALAAGDGRRRAAATPPAITGQPRSSLPPGEQTVAAVPSVTAAERLSAVDMPLAVAGHHPGDGRAGQPPRRANDRPAALPPDSLAAPAVDPSIARRSPQPPSAGAPARRSPHRVNLSELSTRIAGTNLALQAVEAELEEDQSWDARRLGPLVERLGILVMRKNDLAVFYELISPRERAGMARLESPQRAISRLAARITEARTHAAGPGFAGSQSQREAELRELDELSAQLAETAGRK